jgi:dihydroxy-acid dehydratase
MEARMTRSPGTCNTMGTASTMTGVAEALGFTLPGASSIPAMDSAHPRMAAACGGRIVDMVWEDLRPSRIVSPGSLRNAVVTYLALGGSTNAPIHLIALAGRAGLRLTLDEIDALARAVPVLVNLFPSGDRLMEDFYYAGGLPALLRELAPHLCAEALTVTGRSLQENIADARTQDAEVIRPLDQAVGEGRAVAVLHGNLCPDGALIKPSAASPRFFRHRGRALVFNSCAEMMAGIHAPNLEVDEDTVLVLRNAGPKGAPGMPEWGNLPIPRKLLQQGVRDMLRLSDARMSGTHYGSCVVHIAPEAAVGGPLALVETGDFICIDIAARRLDVELDESTLVGRRARWRPPAPHPTRGYTQLYVQHVTQANLGCDFDFLAGPAGAPEPMIF